MQFPLRARLTAAATLLGVSLWGTPAWALTLGEPRVLSENAPQWVVELPLTDWGRIRPDQIQARLAPPPAWQAVGLPYVDPQSIRFAPVTDKGLVRMELTAPSGFLGLLIELQWPRGRLQRELGLLLDASTSSGVPRIGVPAQVWVQVGDTASQLVSAYLDASGTLAQGLLALQQANPEAFVGGNVNRLRAGAVLKLPAQAAIQAIDARQASEMVAQQIEAYASVRAEMAAQSEAPGPRDGAQVATGRVQPAQRDKVETPADRLTLSAPGGDADSERIAQQREAQQQAERAAELNRNIQDLNRLAQSQGGLPAPVKVPEPPPSPTIEQLAAHPLTPWAALGLVALLLWGIIGRFIRRSSPLTQGDATGGLSPLKVDFDLDLPRPDQLSPLSPDVLRAPTPVARPSTAPMPQAGPGVGSDPLAGLWLDWPEPLSAAPPPASLPTDPWVLRWRLAQALWGQGLTQTARVLAREVATQAPAEVAHQARTWLDEHV